MNNLIWFLFFVLLVVDLTISAVQSSLVRARWSKLIDMREENPKVVSRTLNLLEKENLTVTLRAAMVVIHFLLAVVVIWLVYFQYANCEVSIFIELGTILFFALLAFLLEVIIEAMILGNSENWAVRLTPAGEVIDFLFRPFSWFLNLLAKPADTGVRSIGSVTEEELKKWVQAGQAEGALEQEEREMIYSIFHFSDTLCREIMVPRIDVFALEVNTPLEESAQRILESGHSRVPVYDDVIDNVIGLLYAKDILRPMMDKKDVAIKQLLRQAYFVPEAKKVDELLREMQAKGVHISVVVDEYGGMAGLVTLEDIVEEIVGEIRDEYDEGEVLLYQQISDKEYLFNGRIDLEDMNDMLGTHMTREVADTLGGLIYGEIGRVPGGGERVQIEDWLFVVEQVIGRRIRLVRATFQPETENQEDSYAVD